MKVTVVPAKQLPDDLTIRWNEIQQNNPDLCSPFFCPDFTQAVAAVRDDGAAFFPFQKTPFGFGKPVGGPVSDYHGLIAPRGAKHDLKALMRACKLLSWDFDHVPAAQIAFSPWTMVETESYILDVSNDLQVVSKETRSRYVSKMRKLEREFGKVEIDLDCKDADIVRLCLELKSAQYRRSNVVDLFAMPWARALADVISSKRSSSFSGITSVLRAGGRPVAIHFGMRSKTAWHYWFPAYDLEFGRYSPGMLLLLDMISRAPRLGIGVIDFGKGAMDYKQQLSNRTIPLIEGSVTFSRSVSALRQNQKSLTDWARRAPLVKMVPVRIRKLAWRVQEWSRFR
jgi:CelD/BcsL family acetyltransferase involved in cellulose biosynthesis